MTVPNVSLPNLAHVAEDGSGVDAILRAAAGNHHLATQPGLLQAVATSSATPEQAQTINQYVRGLQLQKMVETARYQGHTVNLAAGEQAVLDAMRVPYNDVQESNASIVASDNAKLAGQHLEVQTDEKGRVLYGTNGLPLVQAIKQQKTEKPKHSGGGGFWHHVGSVLNYAAKPFTFVGSEVAEKGGAALHAARDAFGTTTGGPAGYGTAPNFSKALNDLRAAQPDPLHASGIIGVTSQEAADMRTQGYDPDNPFSVIAYQSSGKAYMDTSGLAKQWNDAHPAGTVNGDQAVQLAKTFIQDPSKVMAAVYNDTTLSAADQANQLKFLSSEDFQSLVKRVGGKRASIGNFVMGATGLDPVAHSTIYNLSSAGVNLAAAFTLDPLLVVGKAASSAKQAQVGLRALDGADPNRIKDILLTDTSGTKQFTQAFRANVQRGTQRFIDNANTIREGAAEGASEEAQAAAAKAYADIRATTPALEPLLGDMTGATRILTDERGLPLVTNRGVAIGKGAPITNMDEFADYLSCKLGLVRLADGRAATEWTLMPGALSPFGFRKMVKAPLASAMKGRAGVALKRASEAYAILPKPDAAVAADGRVIAAQGELDKAQAALDALTKAATPEERLAAQRTVQNSQTRLASMERAVRDEFNNPARLSGEAQRNLLRRGTIDGEGFNFGRMLSTRAEQSARRLTSFLPRNMSVNLTDASSTDKVYKFAQLFLNRADATLFASRWAAADEGARRTMLVGIQKQVAHAAGWGATDAGRARLDAMDALLDRPVTESVEKGAVQHRYAVTEGMDSVADPRLGGQEVHLGILLSDVRDEFTLPSFADLLRNGAQYSVLSRTLGRFFTSQFADRLTKGIKYLQLAKPSTWTRNALEGWLNAAARGEFGDTMKAKAALIQESALPTTLRRQAIQKLRGGSKLSDALPAYRFAPLALISHAMRTATGRELGAGDEAWLKYLEPEHGFDPDELVQMAHDFGIQHMASDLDTSGSFQRAGMLRAGDTPAKLDFDLSHDMSPFKSGKVAKERGFEEQSLNGMRGALIWQARLAHAVNQYPELAVKLMDHAKGATDGDISAVTKFLKTDVQAQKAYNLLRRSSLVRDESAATGWREAVTEADRDQALEQVARLQSQVMAELLYGRNGGGWLEDVDKFIRTNGRAPSPKWLQDHVPSASRPQTALAPKWVAKALDDEGKVTYASLGEHLSGGLNRLYAKMVEDPIQISTSMPVMSANYAKARQWLEPYEQMIAERLGGDEAAKAAAASIAKQQAWRRAWVRTEQIIDDPGLKTQFDIVGRNFFMYSRAVQAMIRRWGQLIYQDPTRLEKMALSLHAAEHAGLVYTNKYGEQQYLIPGTQLMLNVWNKMAGIVPGLNIAQLPLRQSLSGTVLYSVPGAENPLSMPLSPLVNIPVRSLETFFPSTRYLIDNMDRKINGPIGSGAIAGEFMPSFFRNFWRALDPNERASNVASATNSALMNLEAGGHTPPVGASAEKQQRFIDRVETQARNTLFARAVFGLFFPSPTNLNVSSKEGTADAAFRAQGIDNLKDEFQQILNGEGGDYNTALQVWAQLHPDKLMFTNSFTKTTARGASLSSSDETLKWMNSNYSFLKKYGKYAAYFVPESQSSFSDEAYQIQLAMGMRERETPEEFYNQMRVNQAGAIYWQGYDNFKAATQGMQSGPQKKQLEQSWSMWANTFKQSHPLFQQSLDVYADRVADARQAVGDFKEMLADGSVPNTVPKAGLKNMIESYDNYKDFQASHKGTSAADQAVKTSAEASYQEHMQQVAASDPSLLKIYNAIFRQLSPQLTEIQNATEGVG